MTSQPKFALNHMTAPRLDCRAFLDLAASLNCVGVELRNDLADKKLTAAPFFDGEHPAAIGAYARAKGLRLLGLSEAYGFNAWSDSMRDKVQLLIEQAAEAGAESISLIPRNDAPVYAGNERDEALRQALSEIMPMLDKAKLIALIEPLGFVTSSLRHKADAVASIKAVGGEAHFKLVHDTFHHHLAGERDFFPAFTGIVHISGVVDPSLAPEDMQDRHRVLVDDRDRLENTGQLRALLEAGYAGAFSYEAFSTEVHTSSAPAASLRQSMEFVVTNLAR
ncbi:TIM barrel protein [Mesorhizobium sp. B4-1-4]|uniref:TIM barrel protein n=1 Tax=Mesorhizobium sp. B4-1-4 TaxID=2589888 RepID=UPI001127D608|nr:TIM barrel protein [Mesorhizobium sp. B4-1-4]UCI32080.1 TIM barrel protein [Mesorhizobium sp. B4-1-4]